MINDGSASVRITLKWKAEELHLSMTIMEDTGEGNSLPWAEPQAAYMIVYLAWKEKQPNVQSFTDSRASANELTEWSGT